MTRSARIWHALKESSLWLKEQLGWLLWVLGFDDRAVDRYHDPPSPLTRAFLSASAATRASDPPPESPEDPPSGGSHQRGAASMRELVELLIGALVGRTTGWEIKEFLRTDDIVVLEIHASKEDMGAIIGKGGAHFDAVRTILRAAQRESATTYILDARI